MKWNAVFSRGFGTEAPSGLKPAPLALIVTLVSMGAPLYAQTVTEDIAARAQAAQEAEHRNDFAAAVQDFEYVTKRLPRNAEMQSNLGVALYFDGELMRSIAVFRKAIALNSSLLPPHLFSGLAWYRLSNPDAAVPELERAVNIKPSDVLAHTWLGYAYSAQFRYEPALKQFRAAGQLDPTNIDVWYALGQTYLQVGKDATRKLLAVAPDGARAWELAGEQEALQGDHRAAAKDFAEARKRRPEAREDALYRQAHQAEENARGAFERVGKIAPDSYRAHEIMGDALVAEGRPAEAIKEYRIVLQLKPDLPEIHEAIGKALLGTGKVASALQEFRAELRIQPRSASALINAGQALLLLGDADQAAQVLNQALQTDRPPPDLYRLVAKLDLRRNEYRSAAAALTHYVSIRKNDSRAYYLLANAYRGLGEKEKMRRALSLYEKTSRDAKARSRAQEELDPVPAEDEKEVGK